MASVVIDLIAKVQEEMTLYGHMAFSLEYTYLSQWATNGFRLPAILILNWHGILATDD
jgi:hypothetical protein